MKNDEVYKRLVQGARLPRATYRVQLNHTFTFEAVNAIIDYLDKLGVSDLYASPFFKARPGSMHGYDIVDHNALNPEIGTSEDLDKLHELLSTRGMGLLLDFVPNHMGVHTPENTWWMDVLENGPSSLYAPFFDIDWHPLKSELQRRVLLPILGEHYGKVLESGELALVLENGAFFLHCYGKPLPINPRTYPMILEPILSGLIEQLGAEHDSVLELQSILTGLSNLPPRWETQRAKVIERRREKEILKKRLAALIADAPDVARAIEARIKVVNGTKGDSRSFDALDRALEDQPYRLSYWRVAGEEINYRRFFDINDLAAIRMENPAVFKEAHRLLFQLIEEGKVTGVRIDHPDGLWNPAFYFAQLQKSHFAQVAAREGSASLELQEQFDQEAAASPEAPPRPLYISVEKILSRNEELPRSWAVHGTSGYEFVSLIGSLFVDRVAERKINATYRAFTGLRQDFETLIYEKKKLILETALASELNVLSHELNRISERDRNTRDFTLGTLTDALTEIIACFPVYRTYFDEATTSVTQRDKTALLAALRAARRRNPTTDVSLFVFLASILLLDQPEHISDEDRSMRRDFVMHLQQLTGPVMAKGLEDTSFYIYNRLSSLNEVGGEPERFGIGVEEFHRGNTKRQKDWPYSMLATSTHDTKRSEDVRSRISVLSELPDAWDSTLQRMGEAATPFRTDLEGSSAPDRNEEYLYYQTLLGTWPAGAEEVTEEYAKRLVEYMRKATKEAKVNTSWTSADPTYDAAVEQFVLKTLAPGEATKAFREALLPLARTVAYHGMWGALSQTLLKLTAPGAPDIYQGNELWDFSLVDPDNRRPVDYELRQRILAEIKEQWRFPGEVRAGLARALVESATDGRIKLFVTYVALTLRRNLPDLFGADGAYVPISVEGQQRENVVAFARRNGEREVLVVAPRFSAELAGGRSEPPIGALWTETALQLEPASSGGEAQYKNLFTGETLSVVSGEKGPSLPLSRVLADFPVALLVR